MTDDTLHTSVKDQIPMAVLAGGTVAAWAALPEVVQGRWTRLALRGALIAGAAVGVAVLDEEPKPRPRRDERMATLSRALEDPAQRAAIWLIALVGMSVYATVENTALDAGAQRLRDRGMRAPRTMLGLGLGAIAAGTQLVPEPKKQASPQGASGARG